MGWVRLDDAMPQHRKILRLPDDALRWKFVSLLCWCAQNRNDGVFERRELLDVWTREAVAQEIAAFVSAGGSDASDDPVDNPVENGSDPVDDEGFAMLAHGSLTGSSRVAHANLHVNPRALRERSRRQVGVMIRAGLLDELDDGRLAVHDYLDYQISREADDKRREGQRARQRRYEEARAGRQPKGKGGKRKSRERAVSSDASDTDPDASSRARVDPTRPPLKGEGRRDDASSNGASGSTAARPAAPASRGRGTLDRLTRAGMEAALRREGA